MFCFPIIPDLAHLPCLTGCWGWMDYLGGFGYIIAGTGPGNATHEQTTKHMTLFQTEVVPALKKYHEQKVGKAANAA